MSPSRPLRQVLLSTICLAVLTVGTTLVVRTARADVPPPEGYVETCTVEQQQNATTLCESCSANHSDRQKCTTQYASTPFEQRCRSRGASVWTEIWCRPREAAAPTEPQTQVTAEPHVQVPPDRVQPPPPVQAPPAAATTTAAEDDSCSVSAPGSERGRPSVPWLAGALVVLFIVRARRASKRAD